MNQQQRAVVQQALDAMKGIRELHRGQGGLTLSEINRIHKNHHKSIDELTQLLEAETEPVQEPVACANGCSKFFRYTTTPPAQPAVPLTTAQLHAMMDNRKAVDLTYWQGVRDAEAHHKITATPTQGE